MALITFLLLLIKRHACFCRYSLLSIFLVCLQLLQRVGDGLRDLGRGPIQSGFLGPEAGLSDKCSLASRVEALVEAEHLYRWTEDRVRFHKAALHTVRGRDTFQLEGFALAGARALLRHAHFGRVQTLIPEPGLERLPLRL